MTTTARKPKGAITPGDAPDAVYLHLCCNNHHGYLDKLIGFEVLDRRGEIALDFEGNLADGDKIDIAMQGRHYLCHIDIHGPLVNGGKVALDSHHWTLQDWDRHCGNMCWDMVQVTHAEAARLVSSVLKFQHWTLSAAHGRISDLIVQGSEVTGELLREVLG